jgi:hypothetical protein
MGHNDYGVGVYGTADNSSATGVYGESERGTAVLGYSSENGIAVKASKHTGSSAGYGFYQEGNAARNYMQGTLAVGTNVSATGTPQRLEVGGGVRINTSANAGACTSANRGTFWFVQGGSGAKDVAQVCAKDAAGSYAWRTLW